MEKLNKIHSQLKFLHGDIRHELPEQLMAVNFVEPDDIVLELGSNIGRNSLTIASLLSDQSNLGLISHNEILTMYKNIVDPTFTWQNFTEEEQKQILASERSNNFMDTTRLTSLYPDILNIKVLYKNVCRNIKKKN